MRELAPFSFLTGHHMPAPFLGVKRFSPKQGQETAHLSRLPLFHLLHLLAMGSLSKEHPRLESVKAVNISLQRVWFLFQVFCALLFLGTVVKIITLTITQSQLRV